MTDRWEYLVLETAVTDQWRPGRRKRQIEELNARINDLGRDGWELVGYGAGVVPASLSSVGLCFFKRLLIT